MKSPVQRIAIFANALETHREARHGGERAVVRHTSHNCEARAAVGAVVERVAKTAIGAAKNLPHTIVAGGDVRCDQNVAITRAVPFVYLKPPTPAQRNPPTLTPTHHLDPYPLP